ncbi:MAG: hypothetical protein COU65_03770 [Candidatus Pacebacteria bacterium CG10_big_fil_rev_8_21_14_0_10_42_12]|nr:hypothetical protein [Candidatus Paceibacterota bacterium]PIR62360.1 MAG: hypothetical protein COU65_03770 [Candidatus Pacebacteria bacterium CG10_big_fil_rev_8_21_14_0_10_42_12]
MKKILTFLAIFFLSATVAFAQIKNPVIGDLGNSAENANNGSIFTGYFIVLWRSAITIGALAVIVLFIQGAIEWITAGGDSGKIESARNRLTQSAIGLFILVSSFTIIAYVSKLLFGTDFRILMLQFPSATEQFQEYTPPVTVPGQPVDYEGVQPDF